MMLHLLGILVSNRYMHIDILLPSLNLQLLRYLLIVNYCLLRHMQRKIRRETLSGQQRFDKFIEQNGVLLLSFGSGAFIGQIGS